ncbi:MAG: MurR/RpiR family transcriptional regulator, partial [Lachnospiraceae bacterium]
LKQIAITAYINSPVAELADCVLLSNGEDESFAFNYYKSYAHLNETAVIDALLKLVTNQKTIVARGADKPELILSENKF